MTGEQESKSIHYAVMFLRGEIEKIKGSLQEEEDHNLKKLLHSRLEELQEDLIMFERLNG